MPGEHLDVMGAPFAAVAAVTRDFGIGRGGDLPWSPKRLTLDMAFLRFVTTHRYAVDGDEAVAFAESEARNVVIMGRRTWDSIPTKFRPMEGRVNVVITRSGDAFRRQHGQLPDVFAASSLEDAIGVGHAASPHGQIFILGGSEVYSEALKHPRCECVFLTRLREHPELPCDTFFPAQELQRFPRSRNITNHIFGILAASLPKSSTIVSSERDQSVNEHGITYEIVLHTK